MAIAISARAIAIDLWAFSILVTRVGVVHRARKAARRANRAGGVVGARLARLCTTDAVTEIFTIGMNRARIVSFRGARCATRKTDALAPDAFANTVADIAYTRFTCRTITAWALVLSTAIATRTTRALRPHLTRNLIYTYAVTASAKTRTFRSGRRRILTRNDILRRILWRSTGWPWATTVAIRSWG